MPTFLLPVWPSVSPAGTSASAYVNSFSVVLSAARLRVGMLAPGAMFRPEMAPSTKMRFNVAFCQSDETSRDLEALLNEQALLPTWRFLPQARVFRQFAPSAPAKAGEGAER